MLTIHLRDKAQMQLVGIKNAAEVKALIDERVNEVKANQMFELFAGKIIPELV